MRTPRAALAIGSALLAVMLTAARAGAIQVAVSPANGLAGQTVDVAISTSNVSPFNVKSFQLSLSYNPSVITVSDVLEAGDLVGIAGWGDAQYHVTNNSASSATLRLSAAGTTALSGAGALLHVRFQVNPALLNGGYSSLTLSNSLFNEGTPLDTLTNAAFTVGVTPQITVYPDNAEVIRGQTQAFSVSGSVSNPVSWFTTDNGIATISPAGVLTGVAPGSVRVFAVDNAGRRDTTNDVVLVRGMGISVANSSFVVGQSASVPINVTSLTGLGIRSGQFRITYNAALLTPTGVTTPPGTLLNGWGPVLFHAGPGNCSVDFVGSTDLGGTGVLCYVQFASTGTATGSSYVSFDQALFNENLPAKPTAGYVTVQALPTITVGPDDVTLLAGQTQQYTITGTTTPPITWEVLDPTIATISPTGLLTALKGGVTQVRATDNLGATDATTALRVYDFQLSVRTVKGPPGSTVRVSLDADRMVGALGIYSMQYELGWSGTNITAAHALQAGLVGSWSATDIVELSQNPRIRVAAAGVSPLPDGGTEVHALAFTISPTAPLGTTIPLTLTKLVFNEGSPVTTVVNGSIQVSAAADAPPELPAALALAPCEPNPVRGEGRVRFTLPSAAAGGERARLTVHGLDGGRVRTLVDGVLGAGAHEARWDGRDEAGRPLSPGLYFLRLEWRGEALSRKLTLAR